MSDAPSTTPTPEDKAQSTTPSQAAVHEANAAGVNPAKSPSSDPAPTASEEESTPETP